MKKRWFTFLLVTVSLLLMLPFIAQADVIDEPHDSSFVSTDGLNIPVFAIVLVVVLVVFTIVLIRIFWKRK